MSEALPIVVFGSLNTTASLDVVFGSLDTTAGLDVDFFRFSVAPNTWFEANLEGASTEKGTLNDPLLGFFDSGCNLLMADDDGGEGVNSRIANMVPANGEFVLGVTSCCDWSFTGGGPGSYTLRVEAVEPFNSISGRLVDGSSGEPISGGWGDVVLLRCGAFECEDYVGSYWVNGEGRFWIEGKYNLPHTSAGEYVLEISVRGYETTRTERFYAGPYEDIDLGDIPLPPLKLVDSISGRLVDALSGEPIRGGPPYFGQVELVRCENPENCFWPDWYTTPDEQGLFGFTSNSWDLLEEGFYLIRAHAEQYRETVTTPFFVAQDQAYNTGDVPLEPLPIQITNVSPCGTIPPQGGTCSFSLTLRNGSYGRFSGSVWVVVDASNIGSTANQSQFQVGRGGAGNPAPEKFNLKAGKSTTVDFQFTVPPSVQDGAWICLSVQAGENPDPVFKTQAARDLFCIIKEYGTFALVSPKDARKHLKGNPGARARAPGLGNPGDQ